MYKDVIGLYNSGNSCYLNSTLQILLNLQWFNQCVKVMCNEKLENKCTGLLDTYNEVTRRKENERILHANPVFIKNILSQKNSLFRNSHQQDCHECLILLLDIFHNHCKFQNIRYTLNHRILSIKPKLIEKSNIEWTNYFKKNGYSFINHLFSGQLRYRLKCMNCGKKRNQFEIFNNLSFSFPHDVDHTSNVTIRDCVYNFFYPEILSERIECTLCGTNTPTEKRTFLWRYPKVLILHLQRFKVNSYTNFERQNCFFETTPYLTFNENVKKGDKMIKRTIEYELVSIVNHIGYSPYHGHYTIHVKRGNQWICIDDENVYLVDMPKIRSRFGYMYIYKVIQQGNVN